MAHARVREPPGAVCLSPLAPIPCRSDVIQLARVPWEPILVVPHLSGVRPGETENEKVLSLDELLAKSEQVDQGLIQRRRQRDEQVVTARDDWALVEVGVNGHGDVVEVAINAALVRQVEPLDLAEAVLQAARAAQRQARGNPKTTRRDT